MFHGYLPRKYRLCIIIWYFYEDISHLVICLTRILIRLYWRLRPLPVISFWDDWWCLSSHYTVIQDISVTCMPADSKLPFIYFLFSWCRCSLLPSNLCLGRCRINLSLTYYACPLVRGEGQRDGCCTSRGRIFKRGKLLVFEVRVNRDATCWETYA